VVFVFVVIGSKVLVPAQTGVGQLLGIAQRFYALLQVSNSKLNVARHAVNTTPAVPTKMMQGKPISKTVVRASFMIRLS